MGCWETRAAMASTEARGFPLVLGLLIAFDVLTFMQGAAGVRDMLNGAAPIATWPLVAWLFAAGFIAMPLIALIGISVALLWRRGSKGARIAWAAAPLAYSLLWAAVLLWVTLPTQSL